MSRGILWGAVASAALAAGAFLVSILQEGDWLRLSTPPRYCFLTYITTIDWYLDLVQHAGLGLSK